MQQQIPVSNAPATFAGSHCLILFLALNWIFGAPVATAQSAGQAERLFAQINWTHGPATVRLGNVATIELPSGYWCATDVASLRAWSEFVEDPYDSRQVGLVIPDPRTLRDGRQYWSLNLSYEATGYVRDDEKDQLDDEVRQAILEAIRAGTEEANKERRQQGWPTLQVLGWQTVPHYDARTNNLTWSLLGRGSDGSSVANYNSRLLGRSGVLSANMVISPEAVVASVPAYDSLISGIRFVRGQSYAEFRSGDKTAAYGLTALATGGTAVAVAKGWKGFAKLGAVLIALAVGLLAALGKLLGRIKDALTGGPRTATAGAAVGGEATAGTTRSAEEQRIKRCGVCGQSNRLNPSLAQPMCGRCGAILG